MSTPEIFWNPSCILCVCILSVIYHHLLLNLGGRLFDYFSERGSEVSPGNFVESFLHFGAFYRLFDTIFLKRVW